MMQPELSISTMKTYVAVSTDMNEDEDERNCRKYQAYNHQRTVHLCTVGRTYETFKQQMGRLQTLPKKIQVLCNATGINNTGMVMAF